MTRREQELLSSAALTAFRLNGQFLELAEHLARPAGITAAWWQVLGAVIGTPLSVSDIGRVMGISRQAVQRTADLLVGKGLVEYHDNPAHRRAKLVVLTEAGRAAMSTIGPHHARHAELLAEAMGAGELADAVAAMTKLSEVLDKIG
ncbi:MAG TPA: MarR family transcriptional regulator [Pseudonocardiaceae bacterium]